MRQRLVRDTICVLSLALHAYFFAVRRHESSGGLPDAGLLSELGEDLPEARLLGANSSGTQSSGTSSSSGSSSSDGSHGGHHGHSQHALLFLLIAMLTGVTILHLKMKFPALQETVGIFCLGMTFSLIIEIAGIMDDMIEVGVSYGMWMGIEPHLLVFTLLPPLLAGDAMTIDTTVAKRVAYQCLYLAGPGVLIQAFAVAGILYFYLEGWGFFLCLTMGSILCATDPVAVVALLKELGASPMLTVQIQGESLLNDGTSIVLFKIAYNVVSGVKYDEAGILDFFLKTAMMAWALGMFIGYVFFFWIRTASNKLEHSSSMIQILLTLCCAYFSFCVAEGILGLSGVLSTVAASLVLADNMWPHIVSAETMHSVWHAFESIGNIVIFFLGGAITGKNMYESVVPRDVLDLFVIYFILLVVRGAFIFGSRPLLRLLNKDRLRVKSGDAAVMTWGGLRGAVGLALAIEVSTDRAINAQSGEPQIPAGQGQKVLFFVSGIAFLTTIVNATTAPTLVRRLGILAKPAARLRLQQMLFSQLVNWSKREVAGNSTVEKGLEDMGKHINDSISGQQVMKENTAVQKSSTCGFGIPSDTLIKELVKAEERYNAMAEEDKVRFKLPSEHLLGKVDSLKTRLQDSEIDLELAKVVNETFLSLVITTYRQQVADRVLPPGSVEAKALISSVQVTSSRLRPDLTDFEFILDQMTTDENGGFKTWWGKDDVDSATLTDPSSEAEVAQFWGAPAEEATPFHKFMASATFQLGMATIILLNTIYVLVDGAVRNSANEDNAVWLVFEVLFTVIFIVEFVMKIKDEHLKYFKDGSNIFDFFLVIVGTLGCLVELSTRGEGADLGASEARTLRVVRVFRVLRFLRIFRLIKTDWMDFISPEVVSFMKTIRVFTAFVQAHTDAQVLMMKYFLGDKGSSEGSAEVARCILQSQCALYKAIAMTVTAKKHMDTSVLEQIESVTQMMRVAEGLENYVLEAHDKGALNARETEHILHPLHHEIQHMMKEMQHLHGGKSAHAAHADGTSGHTGDLTPKYQKDGALERGFTPDMECDIDEDVDEVWVAA